MDLLLFPYLIIVLLSVVDLEEEGTLSSTDQHFLDFMTILKDVALVELP